MENPLLSLLQEQNIAVQFYGLPGTYKTTFLLQIIHKRLKEGDNLIYLIDTSDNFPIVRLKSIKHLLQNIIVFRPKTVEEQALLLESHYPCLIREQCSLFGRLARISSNSS